MSNTAPLHGIQVLDLTRAMAGPFCTQLLGDMGADIVKVEPPGGGDETRRWGPFWDGHSCYFLSANRNKKSIVVDLKSAAGREIVRALVARSDVLIENFRPGTAARLGAGYEAASEINPQLIYCSLSGYGSDGPRARQPAYDLLMQGYAGLMGLTGYPDMSPARAGLPISDLAAALYAAFGIATALFQRAQDGQGQLIETSLMEGQVSWLSYYLVAHFANGYVPPRMGSSHPSLVPYRAYRAEDVDFVLAVGNDGLWRRLCVAIGIPESADDPRFATNVERLANREAVDTLLQGVFGNRKASEWIEVLAEAGVPCGPINTVDNIAAEDQVWHMGMVQEVPHPEIADLKLGGIPVKFSRTPGAIQGPPPMLGEHTDQILSSLEYSQAQIADLRSKGVVA